jgi:putative transposase
MRGSKHCWITPKGGSHASLTCGWTRATAERAREPTGYRRLGTEDWVQKTLGWTVEIVSKPRKPAPEDVLIAWAREWAKEGVRVDWQKLMPPQGFVVLPRRWVVERTFSWLDQNRRMSKDYEKLTATSEAFIYVAMVRVMVRRLAAAK